MDFKEYVKLAMKTNVEDRSFQDNILNGLLGLCGETIEFLTASEDGKLDELGDCYWYTALLFHTTGLELLNITKAKNSLMSSIGLLSDHFKKHFFQGHSLDSNLVQVLLSDIKFRLDVSTTFINSSPEEVMEHNINKLKKRFPEGFEVEKSINRKGN
ncbi:MAG TPA: hypothetical protein GX745_07295 [Clostridiales bacterium]|nr:hypothetical protein [Clostridiales bacterium]